MTRRVLLTGSAGFIGAPLARLVRASGDHLTVLVRRESDLRRLADLVEAAEIVRWEPSDEGISAATLPGPFDLCVHLAWSGISGSGADPDANTRSVAFTLDLLKALAHAGCARFVGIGTGLEYRPSDAPHAETDEIRPIGPYGTAKADTARLAETFCEAHGIDFAWARLFHVYGPDDDSIRFIPWLIRTLASGSAANVTGGAQLRDYLFVNDAADAIWSVSRGTLSGPVNVASGSPVTLKEVASLIAELLGRAQLLRFGAIPYLPDEPMVMLADPSRLFGTGWRPRSDLATGLRATVEWWIGRAEATTVDADR